MPVDLNRPAAARRVPDVSVRRVVAMSWPLVLHGLVNVVVAINDVLILGSAGPRTVASAVVASSVLTVLVMAVGALAIATQIEAARSVGMGDAGAARSAAEGGLRLAAMIGAPVLLLVWAAAGPLTDALGGQAADSGLATSYLRLTLLGLPAALAAATLRSYATALSKPRVVLVAGMAAAGTDVVLSFALEPILGWRGVAIGTACGYLSSAASFAVWRARLPQDRRPVWPLRRVGTERTLFALGWPESLFALFSSAAGLVVVVLLAESGPEVLAASRYLAVQLMLSQVALLSVGQALLTPLAECRGGGHDDDYRRGVRNGALVLAALAAALFVVCAPLSAPMVDLLAGRRVGDEVGALGWLNWAQVFWQGSCALVVAVCRSLRDTRAPLIAGLIAEYVVFLPLGWWLCRVQGQLIFGVLLAHHAFWATFVAVATWRARAAWRREAAGLQWGARTRPHLRSYRQ